MDVQMDPDDVVIEYLRGKLKAARGSRAANIMKPAAPPMEAEAPMDDDTAELEGLLAEGPTEEAAEGEPCEKCGQSPCAC
jgi:hypothetical protein